MKLQQFVFIAVLLTAAAISGSGQGVDGTAPAGDGSSDVIDLNGLHDVEFGDSEQELARQGVLRSQVETCGPALAEHETVNPIFVENRLVLLWASQPVRTPEGVTAGTPVSTVRTAYPSVTRLTAPAGTHRFDGLLARKGDRAYLFLHDGRIVRNTIAGYAEYAEKLFDEGYSPC